MTEDNEQLPPDMETLFQDEVINAEQVNQTIRDSGAPAGRIRVSRKSTR